MARQRLRPTRTLNPLPFRDLEPRRFEDLVRALAYDFRPWKSLEAIGRSGGDEGIDIRGTEVLAAGGSQEQEGEEDTSVPQVEERLWIFQCKREQAISPSRIPAIVKESIPNGATPPFGFILAAACDISKKARDAFRQEMVARGVQEFLVWSRGELEDMLVQPKNDHVLFAFFNISLLPRRRSVTTTIRNPIIVKKQLERLLNNEQESSWQRRMILVRDPLDDRYPRVASRLMKKSVFEPA